jgi:hypothetical protein
MGLCGCAKVQPLRQREGPRLCREGSMDTITIRRTVRVAFAAALLSGHLAASANVIYEFSGAVASSSTSGYAGQSIGFVYGCEIHRHHFTSAQVAPLIER